MVGVAWCGLRRYQEKRKNYDAGSRNHSPQYLRKKGLIGNGHRKAPPPLRERKYQWGSGGLQV